jgi:hypothetical protein
LERLASDHPDRPFYEGKLHAAEYFAHWVLPLTSSRLATLTSSPSTALEISDASFGP